MMNPEVKAKWLAALRSGEYEQGETALQQDTNEFCCLGVLCDLYAKEHPEAKWVDMRHHGDAYLFVAKPGGDQSTIYPPHEVQEWAALESTNPMLQFENTRRTVSNINDSGAAFTQIANLIEEQL